MTTDQKLIRATCLLGFIPLIVGLSIFFSWWIGKAWYLTTLHKLEDWGMLWILISIPLALAGLLTAFIYIFRNFKNNWQKGLFALLCVLINIPAVIWVLIAQGDIDKRAYIRMYNNSGFEIKSLTIGNSLRIEKLASIENGEYETGYFYPNYFEYYSNEPDIEQVVLTIETEKVKKGIIVPAIYKGECLKVSINDKFNIDIKGRWDD
jgi:hypothetical protein